MPKSTRSRILMENFIWHLELGESVPDLASPPSPDPPAVFRNRPKAGSGKLREKQLRDRAQYAGRRHA